MADKLAPSTRHQFKHNGQTVYEWDQTFSEVNIYVEVPPGISSKALFCDITTSRVSLGIKGNPPYLAHDLSASCKKDESFWTLEDSTLHISLTKSAEGEPWPSAFAGHAIDAKTQQEDQQRLMLERFQMENPGFDFSGATFNGAVPNPRTFMKDIADSRE
mmetsp:Transcript_10917/g.32472  ORF Transcript_10917/g.32472 Transcript_10917/m.32472 type:complete len:160 (-) Transcript_10917:78-557(-)